MSDASSPTGVCVRKRDGRVEPFNRGKLLACLVRVLHEAGHVDPPAAAEGLVETTFRHLEQAELPGPVPAPRMRELVEAVLSQLGHGTAAELLRRHAQVREHQRRQVHVAAFRRRRGRYVQRRWSKSAVVHTLRTEHGLGDPAARWLATSIETAVLRSGIRLVTTGLVRELIASELLTWGLNPALHAVASPRRPAPSQEPRRAIQPE